MYSTMPFRSLFVCVVMLTTSNLFAASSNFISIETFYVKPERPVKVLPFAINLSSYPASTRKVTNIYLSEINSNLVYVTKVQVNDKFYYRVVMGNFSSHQQANKQLSRVKQYYPGAWINKRPDLEIKKLGIILKSAELEQPVEAKTLVYNKADLPIVPAVDVERLSTPLQPSFAEKLLQQSKQLFLDHNYARVIQIANKVIEIGDDEQKQKAMELAGISRERQRKFAQAIVIYTEFLDLYPDSELSPKIKNRLIGLKTMRIEPKRRMAKRKRKKVADSWNVFGSFSQYYRDDIIEREEGGTEEINSTLVSDINLFARHKTDQTSLVIRFDAGMVNEFIDDITESRISRAMVNYTNNDAGYQLIGGRQTRTAKGVLGRFDGIVYKGLSHTDFNYSVYTGYPVQSSFDSLDTNRQFIGSSVNFKLFKKVDMDVYFLHQEISDLTDRQALGTEFQYRNDKGFLYGIVDYDLFYSNLNNVTAITNYRFDDKWTLNLTYDYRNSPLLTTLNALQGQSVISIDELLQLFSEQRIYQLAEDRTSKSQNLFVGMHYQMDDNQQLFLSLSLSTIEATEASGGVAEVPSTEDINLAGDYTIRGFFTEDDYTTLGLRLSDTASSENVSLQARTRFPGSNGLRYDPRLRVDYRQSKNTDVNQWIIKPSFKVTYKPTKKLSLEASLSIEHSDFDLPELDDQTSYSLFLGYVYQF